MKTSSDYLDRVDRLRERLGKTSVSSRRRAVTVTTFIFVVLILCLEISPFGYRIEAGKPSPREIVAPKTVQFIDNVKTEEQEEAAAEAVQDVYVRDNEAASQAENSLEELFQSVGQAYALDISIQEKAQLVASAFAGKVDASQVEALLVLSPEQRRHIQDASLEIVKRVMEERITEDTLDEAADKAETIAGEVSVDTATRSISGAIAASFLQPNSFIDEKETEKRMEAARKAVPTVITTHLEGDVIVGKGEVVTTDQVALLKSLGFQKPTFTPIDLLYIGVFALLLLGMIGMFLARYRRVIYDSPGLLGLLGALVIVYTILAKVLAIAAGSASPSWGYLMPIAAVAIITAVLMDSGVAIVMVVACSLLTGVVTGGSYSLVALVLIGGFLPSMIVSRKSSRHELRRAGLYTSSWMALVAFGTTAVTQFRQSLLLNTGIGFLNGLICTIVAMGCLPFLETTFRVTTKTWLLELASPEQELLKELSVKAPGTYSHSVMVANLAEAAAREIGSDAMLARVAAYYHDVGKLKRPQFFIENQSENSRPHNGISPNLSTLVITSHVRDGVEMLEKHHLPPDIVDIVRQHHGTSVVKFFYDKAVKDAGGVPVDENRFRYHFPKPRRRTSGILLLSDAVEATACTLDRPSAAAIEQMVDRIVDGKLADGQLDESDLTLSDISTLKSVFSKILISAYHPRIDYPAAALERRG